MFKTVMEGEKWGALTCIYAGEGEHSWTDRGVTYTNNKTQVLVMKCECGNEATLPRAEFRGKRVMRDCGCGVAGKGRAVTIAFSTPADVQSDVVRIAGAETTNVSQTITMLLRWGIERWKQQKGAEQWG